MSRTINLIRLLLAGGVIVLIMLTPGMLSVTATPDLSPEPFPLKYPAYFGGRFTIPADNPMTREGVHLGRMLFYETKLSGDNSMSCASCHQQRLAFTDGKSFSQGVDHSFTRRNSMSLANLLWVRNLFWDGRSPSLEEQALTPLTDPHEMNQSMDVSAEKLRQTSHYDGLFKNAFGDPGITPQRIVQALAQFERTLISDDSRYDRYLKGTVSLTSSELRGMQLFMLPSSGGIRNANCGHCHGSPRLMVELFLNNGLDSVASDHGRKDFSRREDDRGRFRVPTLRNIALTGPYMHDGRFSSLEHVLNHYSDHISVSPTLSSFITDSTNSTGRRGLLLTTSEKKDIINFLHTLTDSTFITNPAFADPRITGDIR